MLIVKGVYLFQSHYVKGKVRSKSKSKDVSVLQNHAMIVQCML